MKIISKIAVIATALTTLGGVAYAAQSGGNDALAINQAKVSLSQAISTLPMAVACTGRRRPMRE